MIHDRHRICPLLWHPAQQGGKRISKIFSANFIASLALIMLAPAYRTAPYHERENCGRSPGRQLHQLTES
jgi:hypothetical protein